jgi:hypothetical protein
MGDPEKRERKLAKKTGKILPFVKIKMKNMIIRNSTGRSKMRLDTCG